MKEKFQSFGKAMLVPITLIAISGLFLGIGSVFTTELTLVSLGVNWDWYAASPLFTFFSVFKGLGEVIIGNLGVLFAVGCAFSLSRKEKGWAAFSALVCYLTMLKTVEILLGAAGLAADNTTVEALQKVGLTSIQASEQSALYTTSLGFFGYSSGVFGGIIVGCLVACRRNGFAPIVQAALQLVALLHQRLQMLEYLQLCTAAAGKCQQNLICRAAGACGEPCGFDSFEQALTGDAVGGRAAATEWVAQATIGQTHGRTVAGAYGLHAQQRRATWPLVALGLLVPMLLALLFIL